MLPFSLKCSEGLTFYTQRSKQFSGFNSTFLLSRMVVPKEVKLFVCKRESVEVMMDRKNSNDPIIKCILLFESCSLIAII